MTIILAYQWPCTRLGQEVKIFITALWEIIDHAMCLLVIMQQPSMLPSIAIMTCPTEVHHLVPSNCCHLTVYCLHGDQQRKLKEVCIHSAVIRIFFCQDADFQRKLKDWPALILDDCCSQSNPLRRSLSCLASFIKASKSGLSIVKDCCIASWRSFWSNRSSSLATGWFEGKGISWTVSSCSERSSSSWMLALHCRTLLEFWFLLASSSAELKGEELGLGSACIQLECISPEQIELST